VVSLDTGNMTKLWPKSVSQLLLITAMLSGCQGSSQDSEVDGGEDAGADAVLDAGDIVDSGVNPDAGNDAGTDTDLLEPMEPVEYVDLSSGYGFTCGVRSTGAVDCWGDFTERQGGEMLLPPADLRLKSVSAGNYHVCGVSADDGTAVCWGSNVYNESTPPEGVFDAVTADYIHSCGLRPDGSVECWGSGYFDDDLEVPTGEFVQISAGSFASCALRSDGSVECWPEKYGSPQGDYSEISHGLMPFCGIHPDGTADCWDIFTGEINLLFDGTYSQVSFGAGHTCVLRTDSTVECQGEGAQSYFYDISPKEQLAQPPFSEGLFDWISVGNTHSCGIRPGGQIACYGGDSLGQATPTEGIQFRKVSAGGGYIELDYGDFTYTPSGCGLDVDGRAHCWSAQFVEYTSVIANYEGKFTDLCASMGGVCGLTEDGTIICSGLAFDGFEVSGNYSSIVCAGHRWYYNSPAPSTELCALDKDGMMTCWMDGALIDDRPQGPFTQISVAGYGGCGIRPDGHLECFVNTSVPHPSGKFIQVEVGATHSCGVHKDGTIECFWSDNRYGQATPPSGEFTHVTTGMYHSCGLRKDGTAQCWGWEFHGEPEPPKGKFISLDAGTQYTCGIRPNGALKCWGKILRGLSQADF
jgi:Regulator of chromosome condensation (RCC1) repeat